MSCGWWTIWWRWDCVRVPPPPQPFAAVPKQGEQGCMKYIAFSVQVHSLRHVTDTLLLVNHQIALLGKPRMITVEAFFNLPVAMCGLELF
jgi:hypothetical protein